MPPLPPITQDGTLTWSFRRWWLDYRRAPLGPGIHVSRSPAKNENVYSVGPRPAERGAAASAAETRTPLRIAFALASLGDFRTRSLIVPVILRQSACVPTSFLFYIGRC